MGQSVGNLVRVLGKHSRPGCPGWNALCVGMLTRKEPFGLQAPNTSVWMAATEQHFQVRS